MSRKYGCREKQFTAKRFWRIQNIYSKIHHPYMTWVKATQSLISLRWKPNAALVPLPSSIPDYYIKSTSKYFALGNRVRVIQTKCV